MAPTSFPRLTGSQPFLPTAAALGKGEEEGRRVLLWLKFEFPSLLRAKYIDRSPSLHRADTFNPTAC